MLGNGHYIVMFSVLLKPRAFHYLDLCLTAIVLREGSLLSIIQSYSVDRTLFLPNVFTGDEQQ